MFFRRSRKKEQKNREKTVQRGPRADASIRYLVRITSKTPSTTTNKLEAGPAAEGRDNEGQMRRSHASSILSRTATSAAPAQRKNCRYFFNLIQMDGTTNTNLVFRRPSDREGILKSSKSQTTKNVLFHSCVPGIYFKCRNPTPLACCSF